MRLLRAFAPLAFLCAACGPQRVERHVTLGCAGPTVESWLPDSSAALCLPTGFVARGRVGFSRPRGDTLPAHRIAVISKPRSGAGRRCALAADARPAAIRRLSLPRHHPAWLGLGAPQDAPGAERCAVSVRSVDRIFATPPDSPGQRAPGLSDDRPRDPRRRYCPELSPRSTRSSSS